MDKDEEIKKLKDALSLSCRKCFNEGRNKGLEDAAKIAENHEHKTCHNGCDYEQDCCQPSCDIEIAQAIRALSKE